MDPNQTARHSDQFFGLEVVYDQAQIVVISVPWDVTTSYGGGTSRGPEAILRASFQLDLYSPYVQRIWELPLYRYPLDQSWLEWNDRLRLTARSIISALERGLEDDPQIFQDTKIVNFECDKLIKKIQYLIEDQLRLGKKVITLGGDHSVSLAPLLCHRQRYQHLSVLHIDAHLDLRVAYQGFTHSHASVMYNFHQQAPKTPVVGLGMRDVSPCEVDWVKSHPHVKIFFDWDLKQSLCRGTSWEHTCQEIINHLSDSVYITFDIDGLDPKLCPNTGTPVPGGLEYWQVEFLFHQIKKSGKRIVGADLVEVCPSSQNEWDANVGARVLLLLASLMT